MKAVRFLARALCFGVLVAAAALLGVATVALAVCLEPDEGNPNEAPCRLCSPFSCACRAREAALVATYPDALAGAAR